MATTKELNVEDKLRAIYDLQIIDTRIDEIRNVRGELPLEVEDLEDEVTGLSTRLDKLKSDLVIIEEQIKTKKIILTIIRRQLKNILHNKKMFVTIENSTH